jgi:hypothetical protein
MREINRISIISGTASRRSHLILWLPERYLLRPWLSQETLRDSEIRFEKEHEAARESDNWRLLEITRRLDKLEHASRTPVGNESRASLDKFESILEKVLCYQLACNFARASTEAQRATAALPSACMTALAFVHSDALCTWAGNYCQRQP